MKQRVDFHSHTLLSDGVLLLSEQARTAEELNYKALGITDHVDFSNIDYVLEQMKKFIDNEGKYYNLQIISGVEITHTPPEVIDDLAKYAKENGAEIVIVHGETLVEPVKEGTNKAAVNSKYVDILAHPGLIKDEDVKKAAENSVYLEISSRRGHCYTNGHVTKQAYEFGAKLLINSDSHSPSDFITYEFSEKIALASGILENDLKTILIENPNEILRNL